MRRPLTALAGLVLAASVLAACGDDDGDTTATDPGPTGSPSVSSEPPEQHTEAAVSVRKSCAELYHPPAQLMPRAIEFVHGSPSAESATEAEELLAGLATAADRALGPLAEDITIVRDAVDAQRAAVESGAEAPGVAAFDAASNRLAGHCELYND